MDVSNKRLLKWFKKLTTEQRLRLALEIEEFRKEVKIVKDRGDIQSAE